MDTKVPGGGARAETREWREVPEDYQIRIRFSLTLKKTDEG